MLLNLIEEKREEIYPDRIKESDLKDLLIFQSTLGEQRVKDEVVDKQIETSNREKIY
jgi:hypothetical protein